MSVGGRSILHFSAGFVYQIQEFIYRLYVKMQAFCLSFISFSASDLMIAVSGVREHENAVIDNIFQPDMFMLW